MKSMISGYHEVVMTGPSDLRPLKFTHTKQRGAKYFVLGLFPYAEGSTPLLWGKKYLHVGIANHRSRREDFDLLVREVIRIGNEMA